jgi:hypothetical protein
MISLASRQEIAQDTANSYLTCMDVNTDSDGVLYKSKLNIDGLKTCEGRSSLGGQTLHLRQPTTRFLIIWTVFSFVGFRVTIFAFG